MVPSNLATLTDLPHELLTQIIYPLDTESIYTLAKTCKTLHFFALPLFLSRNGIYIRTQLPEYLSMLCPSKEGLIALETSLLATNLRNIQYSGCTTDDANRLFYDIRALRRLLARLPSLHAFTWAHYPSSSNVVAPNDAKPDMQRWSTEFSTLVDTALQKSCQDLFISGGDTLFTLSSDQRNLQELPAPKSWKFLSYTTRRKVLSIFSKTENQPLPPCPPPAPQCASFCIMSSMLLHPQLLCWFRFTLQANAGAMTRLALNKVVVSSSTWHQLLPALTLPALYNFELNSGDQLVDGMGVALEDIETFLRCNPSIAMLTLSGIIIPDTTPRLRKPILPKLRIIDAHPKFIAWILCCKVPQFRPLGAVTTTAKSGEFDYDQFDEALTAIALYSCTNALRLGLNFSSKTGAHEWIQKHISNSTTAQGSVGGCLANLAMVTDLTLYTKFWMRLDDGDEPIVQLLPQFLALFSSLERVDFAEQPFSARQIDLKGCKNLLKKIMSVCPRLKSVLVNYGPIDLTYLDV
ncbi:hypothetical protein K443DRAFT_680042 [Laccaria amethystina LaAM-08-1]|uniref:F-box domain-containing protein n=1 Tax=Laccaria amethystina LaAM-08-1 TaxID=1095629 RepID=A0A0C9XTR0_9AGAR|nr:hypothetical protein K443DRAFT_680042 [Laccaria amethystina LaAM-08-1]